MAARAAMAKGRSAGRRARGVGVLGVCDDRGSSSVRGAALGPAAMREALLADSSNTVSEDGRRDLVPGRRLWPAPTGASSASAEWPAGAVVDFGDLVEPTDREIADSLRRIASLDLLPVALGGDHAVTLPVALGLQRTAPTMDIVQFDAHPDLYPELPTPFGAAPQRSHAAQMTRLLESGAVARIVQVGTRCYSPEQLQTMDAFPGQVVPLLAGDIAHLSGEEIARRVVEALSSSAQDEARHLHVTFDLDVIEPGLAPGVAHPEPGGLGVAQCLEALRGIGKARRIDSADLVELNPPKDTHDQLSARVAAKVLKQLFRSGLYAE